MNTFFHNSNTFLINNIFTNLYNLGDELLVGIVKPQRAKSEYPHIIFILQELRRKLY